MSMQTPSNTSARRLAKGMMVNQIMTRGPVCCLRTDTVQRVAAIMRDEDTGLVPVVENAHEGVLTGVVTDRDLCLAVLADGQDRESPVESCMTSEPVSCHPDDPIVRVLHLMESNQIRRVPVVDARYRVLGVVSLADILRRSNLDGDTTQDAMRQICQPAPSASRPRAHSELSGPVAI